MPKSTLIALSLVGAIVAILLVSSALKSPDYYVTPTPTLEPTPTITPLVKNIQVNEPVANATIGPELIIRGEARVFENVLNYRLVDTKGNELVSGFTTAKAQDVGLFGPYEVKTKYKTPKSEFGTLEVFWLSPKDGSELDKQIIFIKFP